jgi:hypothetical protein
MPPGFDGAGLFSAPSKPGGSSASSPVAVAARAPLGLGLERDLPGGGQSRKASLSASPSISAAQPSPAQPSPQGRGAECYVFVCNGPHELSELVGRRVLGDAQQAWEQVQAISPATELFVFDRASRVLHGAFRASDAPGYALDASMPQRPAQVRIKDPSLPSDAGIRLGPAGLALASTPLWLEGGGVFAMQRMASLVASGRGGVSGLAVGSSPVASPSSRPSPLEPAFAGLALGAAAAPGGAPGGSGAFGGIGFGGAFSAGAPAAGSAPGAFGGIGFGGAFGGGSDGIGGLPSMSLPSASRSSSRRTTSRLACFANLEPGSAAGEGHADPHSAAASPSGPVPGAGGHPGPSPSLRLPSTSAE